MVLNAHSTDPHSPPTHTHTPPETNSLLDTTSLRGTNTAETLPHYEQKVHTDHARAHCLVSLSLPAPEVQAFLLLIFSLSLSRAIFKPGNLHLNCLLISDKPTLFLFARVVQMHVSENVIASISLSSCSCEMQTSDAEGSSIRILQSRSLHSERTTWNKRRDISTMKTRRTRT